MTWLRGSLKSWKHILFWVAVNRELGVRAIRKGGCCRIRLHLFLCTAFVCIVNLCFETPLHEWAVSSWAFSTRGKQQNSREYLRFLAASEYNDCSRPSQKGKLMPVAWSGIDTEFFDDYRRLEDITAFMDRLVQLRSDLVVLRQLGMTFEDRNITLMEITDRSIGSVAPEDKPCIFLEGGLHAREWIGPSTTLFIAKTLIDKAADADVLPLLQKFVFTIVPVSNPDGYVYTWQVNRMWRKNRRAAGQRCPGVDLNRNWGFSWGMSNSWWYRQSLSNPCTELFIGKAAFSEAETAAVSNYMEARQLRSLDLKEQGPNGEVTPGPGYVAAFFDFHSYSQLLLTPWAYLGSAPLAEDGQYQSGLTKAMTNAYNSSSGRIFKAGADLLPPDPGTGPDWAYGALGVRATMTVELEGEDSDSNTFCLPSSNIRSVGREQFAGVIAAAQYLTANGAEPSRLVGPFKDMKLKQSSVSQSLHKEYGWSTLLGNSAVCVLVVCLLLLCASLLYGRMQATRPNAANSGLPAE